MEARADAAEPVPCSLPWLASLRAGRPGSSNFYSSDRSGTPVSLSPDWKGHAPRSFRGAAEAPPPTEEAYSQPLPVLLLSGLRVDEGT